MPQIFNTNVTFDQLKNFNKGTIAEHLGIEYLELTPDSITARMPVDHRTHQPFGRLHGGASVVLAEDLGSVASWLTLNPADNKAAVGLEINANHVKGIRSGWVYGTVTPVHLGKNTHVWNIRITDEEGRLVCISRLTTMIIDQKG